MLKSRNVKYAKDLHSAVSHLIETEQLFVGVEETAGRPRTVYYLPKKWQEKMG